MSSKSKRRKLNDLNHELFCEWNNCSLVFNDLSLYLQHLHKVHIKQDLGKQTQSENQSENQSEDQSEDQSENQPDNQSDNQFFECQWIGCEENNFDNYSQFCLHVSYHGFHQKLMSTGLTIMKELGIKLILRFIY